MKFASQSSSTDKDTYKYKTRESIERIAPILITTANGHVLSEELLSTQKMTNLRGRLNFQKSALELNKKTKSSLYNKLTKRGLKRIQTVSSLPRYTFTHEQQNTKVSSMRKSGESWNPFRERMLINSRNVKKKSENRMMINDIIHEHEENIDMNISGSEYSQDHIVSNQLHKRTYVS